MLWVRVQVMRNFPFLFFIFFPFLFGVRRLYTVFSHFYLCITTNKKYYHEFTGILCHCYRSKSQNCKYRCLIRDIATEPDWKSLKRKIFPINTEKQKNFSFVLHILRHTGIWNNKIGKNWANTIKFQCFNVTKKTVSSTAKELLWKRLRIKACSCSLGVDVLSVHI